MESRRLDWTNVLFLASAHLLAVGAIFYMAFVHFSWATVALGIFWFVMCGIGITAGYHRLFAHPTYQTRAIVRAVYLLFGAASVQNTALRWSASHRLHHAHVDRDRDPYSIKKGFLWAHIGWVLFRTEQPDRVIVNDLYSDPLVRIQHRYYVPIAIMMAAIVPAALGALWGDMIGALLVAGFLRLVVQWHATFSVNSIAHLFGRQTYSTKNSGRDSFWTAFVTFGEGYHNFHHRFKIDYRNGIRWYDFDPTKWIVWGMSKVGLAWNLRRVPAEVIENAKRAVALEAAAVNQVPTQS